MVTLGNIVDRKERKDSEAAKKTPCTKSRFRAGKNAVGGQSPTAIERDKKKKEPSPIRNWGGEKKKTKGGKSKTEKSVIYFGGQRKGLVAFGHKRSEERQKGGDTALHVMGRVSGLQRRNGGAAKKLVEDSKNV